MIRENRLSQEACQGHNLSVADICNAKRFSIVCRRVLQVLGFNDRHWEKNPEAHFPDIFVYISTRQYSASFWKVLSVMNEIFYCQAFNDTKKTKVSFFLGNKLVTAAESSAV